MVHRTVETCARCNRLGLECRIDQTFRRERKRKRTDELEKEVVSLKEELQRQSSSARSVSGDQHVFVNHQAQIGTPSSDFGSTGTMADLRSFSEGPAESFSSMSPQIPPYDYDYSGAMGVSLVENIDQTNIAAPSSGVHILGDVQLSPDAIDDLFREFFINYHPFLPFLDPDTTPSQYFSSAPLLFWAIISVASRRYEAIPDLLNQLAQHVCTLVWRTLQAAPFSVHVVQALTLLCTWPFPSDNSTSDLRYMWTGMMIQIGIHIGLHRQPDPLEMNDIEQLTQIGLAERVRTWAASNIVAQRYYLHPDKIYLTNILGSIGVATGLASSIQCDWSLAAGSRSDALPIYIDPQTDIRLKIGMFCDNVTRSMNPDTLGSAEPFPSHNQSLYYTLEKVLFEIEDSMGSALDLDHLHLRAARVHLQSFYLFDDPSSEGYTERIVALHFTALSFLQHALHVDTVSSGSLRYYPYYLSQTFIASAFIILKILKNDYFANFVDIAAGMQLGRTAIKKIRSMSFGDHDCSGRFGDVLAFFWHAPAHILSGRGLHGLQLHVRNRSSMSVVYDCIWRWKKHALNHTDTESLSCQQMRHGTLPSLPSLHIRCDVLTLMQMIQYYRASPPCPIPKNPSTSTRLQQHMAFPAFQSSRLKMAWSHSLMVHRAGRYVPAL
jgi:transcriptional regulatory protein LEU3